MVTAILIGAGQRGYEVFGQCALENPEKFKFVAVAEPNTARRERFAKAHGIKAEYCYESWEEILELPQMADSIFICTQDKMHTEPTLKALELGYHVLLEKPMSPDAMECIQMGNYAKKYNRIVNIGHVLRYSNFYSTIKLIIDSGEIGQVVHIKEAENVGFWHQGHSFVRGNWCNSEETSPMILQKCCHDMDIISWLIGKTCKKVSSFGNLLHFKKENAPIGSTERCTQDCQVKETCIYNAERYYLGENIKWPVSVISEDTSLEARRKALEEGEYGRCVYRCNNNVVDHQTVNLEFETGKTASVTMCAFTPDCTRTIEVMGTRGYIKGEMKKFVLDAKQNKIEVYDFLTQTERSMEVNDHGFMTGKEGADAKLTLAFIEQVEKNELEGVVSVDRSVESHLMSLAAERSRVNGRTVEIEEFYREMEMKNKE